MRRRLCAFLIVMGCAATAAAQQAVFIVRHAERADTAAGGSPMMATDPDLSEAGRARAASLAALLKDAKISSIYTTQYKRTKQTAEAFAKAAGVEPVAIDSKDLAELTKRITTSSGNVLVVGHSNSVPAIIKALGIKDTIEIGDHDYDNLFIVLRGAEPALIRLHYR